MTKLEQIKLSKLERDLVLAIVGRLGGNFHKAAVVSQVAAKIALELAHQAYDEGRYFGREEAGIYQKFGDGKTFKQFIQDYE